MAKQEYIDDDWEEDDEDDDEVEKVASTDLQEAGLELMRQAGKELTEARSRGRSQIYRTPEGETVRIRTCNDHIFIANAEGNELNTPLNIEGTDYILYVMPEEPRTPGPVMAYLIPTDAAVEDVRKAHTAWRKEDPKARKKGNRTRNVWFHGDSEWALMGFEQKWSDYRLEGEASTLAADEEETDEKEEKTMTLKEAIEEARAMIARIANVDPKSVRIQIDL